MADSTFEHFDWATDALALMNSSDFAALPDADQTQHQLGHIAAYNSTHIDPMHTWQPHSQHQPPSPFTTIAPALPALKPFKQFHGQLTPPDELSPGTYQNTATARAEREDSIPPEQMSAWGPYAGRHDSGAVDTKDELSPQDTPFSQEALTQNHPATRGRKRKDTAKKDQADHALATATARVEKRGVGRPRRNTTVSTPSLSLPASPDSTVPPKPAARRGSKEQPSKAEALEKNRQAAQKCREKKKEWVKDLEARAHQLTAERKFLTEQLAVWKEYVLMLKNEILRHGGCGEGQLNAFLVNQCGSIMNGLVGGPQQGEQMMQGQNRMQMQGQEQMRQVRRGGGDEAEREGSVKVEQAAEGETEREEQLTDDQDSGGGIEFLDDFDVDAMEDAEGG